MVKLIQAVTLCHLDVIGFIHEDSQVLHDLDRPAAVISERSDRIVTGFLEAPGPGSSAGYRPGPFANPLAKPSSSSGLLN